MASKRLKNNHISFPAESHKNSQEMCMYTFILYYVYIYIKHGVLMGVTVLQ